MGEKTELETETRQSPEQAAEMLRDIADEIKGEYDQVEVEVEFEWTIIPEASGDDHADDE